MLPVNAIFFEKGNAFGKSELDNWDLTFKGFEFELLVNSLQLSSVILLKSAKNIRKELTKEIKQLEVMLLDRHFNIQSNELAHVAMSKRVLSTEHRTNFEHFLEISHDTHLLIKLRRLCKTGFLVEVREVKHIGSSF